MDIVFGSIQNVGAQYYKDIKSKSSVLRIPFEVMGEDFDKAENVLCEKFMNPTQTNLVLLDVVDEVKIKSRSTKFFLNGKPLPVVDENIPIFSFLSEITKRIFGQNEKILINDAFIKGEKPLKNLTENLPPNVLDDFVQYKMPCDDMGGYYTDKASRNSVLTSLISVDDAYDPINFRPLAQNANKKMADEVSKLF